MGFSKLLWFGLIPFQLIALVSAQSGTCSSSVPCTSGCCSKSGYCGFGPTYCGSGNCTSTCNAQAQCGQYAPAGQNLCPLNVCCSQYGFCGTTSDFCGTGCQNGCAPPNEPSCSPSSGKVQQMRIGYFESWSYTRSCDAWTPEMINPTAYTHLYYAFSMIQPGSFQLGLMNSYDPMLYQKMVSLKSKNPSLKVFISVGGWSAGGQIFSQMASSSTGRTNFINSAISLMNTYLFDGIDIDWEYPVASDRGGSPADKANYITLLQQLRSAVGNQFQISATIPSSYWYLQNFDIVNMEKYIDWFMLMSYDIHGTWDGTNPYTQAVVNPATNLTEISQSLDLLWRNNINPSNVVMGMAMYGRSFTLKNPSCNTPGCPFASGGNPGPCTATSGILSNAEIQNIIAQYSLTPVFNAAAAVKWITWNNNQWVSYDDSQTYGLKQNFANSKCLAGFMVWALDLDNSTTLSSTNALNSNQYTSFLEKNAISQLTGSNNLLNLGLYWTYCRTPEMSASVCAPGWKSIFSAYGKVFDADLGHITGNACGSDGTGFYYRELCAPTGGEVLAGCQWGAQGKLCDAVCPKGSVLITKNSWPDTARVSCKAGSYVPLCCSGVIEVATIGAYCEFSAIEHNLAGGMSVGQDLALLLEELSTGKLSGRSIGPPIARRAGVKDHHLSKRWDYFGNVNGFSDCFGVGSLPYGAMPVEIPGILQTVPGDPFLATVIPATQVQPTGSQAPTPTITTTFSYSSTSYNTMARTCDFNIYPQACANYQSVGRYSTYNMPTCSRYGVGMPPRPLTGLWNAQHNSQWSSTWISPSYVNPYGKRQAVLCQRDEWPPAMFQQGRAAGYVRLLPGGQNGGVANSNQGGWKNFCQFPAPSAVTTYPGGYQRFGNFIITTEIISTTVTINVMAYSFTNVPNSANDRAPYLLSQNPCYPVTLTYDPYYALLDNDPSNIPRIVGWPYYGPPPASLTQGKTPPTRRRRRVKRGEEMVELPQKLYLFQDDQGDYVVDDGNSTRLATEEELRVHLDLAKCDDVECTKERQEYALHLDMFREQGDVVTAAPSPTATPTSLVNPRGAEAGASLLGSQPTRVPVLTAKYTI